MKRKHYQETNMKIIRFNILLFLQVLFIQTICFSQEESMIKQPRKPFKKLKELMPTGSSPDFSQKNNVVLDFEKNVLVLPIYDEEKLVIESPEIFNNTLCCMEGSIKFIVKNQELLLSKDAIYHDNERFRVALSRALYQNYQLHASINEDIGFLYNEQLQNRPGLAYEKDKDGNHWVGYNNLLWANDSAAWLYTDKDGSIILEITPVYPGRYDDILVDNNKSIPYDAWIQTYKPYCIIKLPREIARKWLWATDTLHRKIEENIKKFTGRK